MGAYAVDRLLEGKSNIVICERDGEIVCNDISFALKLDRMYKGDLEEGELDGLSAEDVERMKQECKERRERMALLYGIENRLNL